MRSFLTVVLVGLVSVSQAAAQSVCQDSCEPRNRSAALGASSAAKSSLLNDPSCSLRLVLKSPARGEEMSVPSGIVERSAMGITVTAPFNKISDLLVLSVALQSDALFPASSGRGAKESIAAMKNMEDDPALGLRWSLVYRAAVPPSGDDKITLRATWRNRGSTSGFSMTEVRLAPANFTLWCR